MQCYYYYPTQQMNGAPNTHKQNATRRPSRESVRALATTAAAPHVCCVLFCMYVCCVVLLSPLWLLLCFWCGGFRASKYTGVPLSVSGYPATLFYPKTRPIHSGFGVMPESCRVLDWFSGFRLTAPNPTAPSTHTQHSTTTTIRASHIRQHTAHPNGYVFYVLLGVWRELETTPLAMGKHSDISHISPSIYIEVSAKPLSQ